MSDAVDDDASVRSAAFQHVRRLQECYDHLETKHLATGFIYQDERIPLINPRRGIFKPQRMRFLLSIKTVFPKIGAKVWYDDQRDVHRQIYEGEEFVDYAFMGEDPEVADNRWLREAWEHQIPIIYFLGIAPGRYQAIAPAFIAGWDRLAKKARVGFGMTGATTLASDAFERRYALRTVKQRLHQASFRAAVISAYRGRCALSGLPEPMLLDAAHIISDGDEKLGQPAYPTAFRFRRSTMRLSMHSSSASTLIFGCMSPRDCVFKVTGRCSRLSSACT